MEKYELQKLRDLPIEGVAERLGLQVTRHKALCPFHDDHHASLSFSTKRNTYRCFVCGASGGTIDLAMNCLHKGFLDACHWLADEHNVIISNPKFTQKEPELLCNFDAKRYERYFEHPFLNEAARRFLFEERRIDPRVVRWCRLNSWTDRNGTPWLQIPYYNREGKLVGIQNRNLKPHPLPPSFSAYGRHPVAFPKGEGEAYGNGSEKQEVSTPLSRRRGDGGEAPRFRFPQGSQCGIYNLPVLNRLKPGDELYITEGCSDCWAMLSAGHKAIAIPSATLLKKKDVELLLSLSDVPKRPDDQSPKRPITFHMYPDRDEPGERLFLQLQQFLHNLVHHQLPTDCKDFSDFYLQNYTKVPVPFVY